MTATQMAIEEVKRAGFCDKDSDYDGDIGRSVIELLECIGKQGHSGMSHARTLDVFKRAASGEPMSDLTADATEWNHIPGGGMQSRRCSHVFCESLGTGVAFTIYGIRFEGENGGSFTGKNSRAKFNLPGMPPKTRTVREKDWRASPELQVEFPGAWN